MYWCDLVHPLYIEPMFLGRIVTSNLKLSLASPPHNLSCMHQGVLTQAVVSLSCILRIPHQSSIYVHLPLHTMYMYEVCLRVGMVLVPVALTVHTLGTIH